jgi:hypothetical protein
MRKMLWSLICSGLIVAAMAVPAARRMGLDFEIEEDQLNSGGAIERNSPSFYVQDELGSAVGGGKTQGSLYTQYGGLSYAIADGRPGDLNEDGKIGPTDLFRMALSWQTEPGVTGYRFEADVVQSLYDRRVNETDFFEMIRLMRSE